MMENEDMDAYIGAEKEASVALIPGHEKLQSRNSVQEKDTDVLSANASNLVVDPSSTFSAVEIERLTNDIIMALKTVYDPEIPTDIYELGLIYQVDIDDDRIVHIDMTLTAPGCPVAGEMPIWIQNAVSAVEGIQHVDVRIVFDPPWDKSRMSDEARIALGMF